MSAYGFIGLLMLMALLSINVGVINLLPIPVLDGGHLVFMAIEVLRGKPLSPRVVKVCSIGGLCVIMVLAGAGDRPRPTEIRRLGQRLAAPTAAAQDAVANRGIAAHLAANSH